MLESILFDMDGLLVDTEPILCKAVINALENQGIKLTEKEYFSHWTRNGRNIKDFIKEKNIDVDIEKYRKDKNGNYFSLIKNSPLLMDGAKDRVTELSQFYELGLVSSSSKDMIKIIIQTTKLQKYFSVIVASEDVKKEKPSPDSFLLAAQLLNIKPENCVVIEDAEKGIIAAKTAGMKAIAIPNLYTKDNDFSKADLVLDNLSQLTKEIIESI